MKAKGKKWKKQTIGNMVRDVLQAHIVDDLFTNPVVHQKKRYLRLCKHDWTEITEELTLRNAEYAAEQKGWQNTGKLSLHDLVGS